MISKINMFFRRPIFGTLVLFLVVVCLFFYKIFLGQIYTPTNLFYEMPPWNTFYESTASSGAWLSDPVDTLLPNMYDFKENIFKGDLSYWTSSHSMGSSTVIETISLLFSPNTLIYLIFPIEYASNIDLMLRIYISLVGMFLFLYKLRLNVNAARIGAIIFSFSLPMIVWLNWPHIWVSCLAPWLFLSIQYIYESKRKWIPVAGFIISCMIYGNMPAYAAYYIYAAGAYYVYLIAKRAYATRSLNFFMIKTMEFTTAVILGIGMAFAYIFNFFQYMNSIGFIEQREGSFHPFSSLKYLISLFDPSYFNNLGIPTMHFNEYSSYFGVATLFIYFFSFIYCYKKKYRKHLFWAISALVLGLVIFGSPLTKLFSYLPGIGTSLATRLLGLMAFLVAVTSAYIYNYLIEDFDKRLTYLSIIVSITCVGILLVTGLEFIEIFKFNYTLFVSFIVLLTAVLLIALSATNDKIRKKAIFALSLLLVVDLFRAGMFYNPTVDAKQVSLQPPTEVTNFLTENLENNRFVALGTWNLFPNSSSYYNINDLRGHSFILRENRMKKFNEAIDPDSYVSETRTGFNNIINYNLLKASAVRYIIAENKIGEQQFPELLEVKDFIPIGEILKGTTIEQSFVNKEQNLSSIAIQFATYNRNLKDGVLKFELIDDQNKVIRIREVKLSDLQDNKYYSIQFEPIENSKDKLYKFRISTNVEESGRAPTIWGTNTKVYSEGTYYYNGLEQDSTLMFKLGYKPDDLMKVAYLNGEYIYENVNALPRAYLINQVKTVSNPDDVLINMSRGGFYHTAYVEESINATALSNGNHPKVIAVKNFFDQGDTITMEVDVDSTQFLVLTDNYSKDWSAFIDGEKTKVYRVNYLFKGIEVPEGEHVIEFQYKPKFINTSMLISAAVYVLTFVIFILFFVRRKNKEHKTNRRVPDNKIKTL